MSDNHTYDNNQNHNNNKVSAIDDFKSRIAATKTTRWIRFSIVSLIFLLWVAWLGSWWVLIFWFLLFDIYITGYIPFTWWKKSKNSTVRAVMAWVDAIVYALVLVYFIFTFVGQNYQIPSSSLEKTLLVGDYLWVNKMAYGPRVPMTPVHFPLVQNTLPVVNTKSYLDSPQWKYHRLKGLGNVERGDIVVFNFPAGDTVATKVPNPDYYTLIEMFGRDVVNENKDTFGDIIYRPVDRRENYVKRCVGLPGENIRIADGEVYIDGVKQPMPENAQFNYIFQKKTMMTERDWDELGVSKDDRAAMNWNDADPLRLQELGFTVIPTVLPIYISPLTAQQVAKIESNPEYTNIIRQPAPTNDMLFPLSLSQEWTRADYGDIHIPAKGETIALNDSTWSIYERVIRNYEQHPEARYDATTGKVYFGDEPQDTYTFEMDYYFMMGDNRDNSLDSRYWGFVPEDHIVGKPMRVLISFDKDRSIFNGGIRWNRIFKNANAD